MTITDFRSVREHLEDLRATYCRTRRLEGLCRDCRSELDSLRRHLEKAVERGASRIEAKLIVNHAAGIKKCHPYMAWLLKGDGWLHCDDCDLPLLPEDEDVYQSGEADRDAAVVCSPCAYDDDPEDWGYPSEDARGTNRRREE